MEILMKTEDIKKRLANNLKTLRKCKGMSIKSFANSIGVPPAHLYNLEQENIRAMYIVGLYRISKEISLDKLFNEDLCLKVIETTEEKMHERNTR